MYEILKNNFLIKEKDPKYTLCLECSYEVNNKDLGQRELSQNYVHWVQNVTRC